MPLTNEQKENIKALLRKKIENKLKTTAERIIVYAFSVKTDSG